MDYEKKYKEALERAREWYNKTEPDSYTCIVESIFPELKESEDGRVIQRFIKLVKMSSEVGGSHLYKWEAEEMLAWLEKQGEKSTSQLKFKVGDFVKDTNHHKQPIYKIVSIDKECYICESDDVTLGDKAVMHFAFDNPYLRLVEQKPADKIEHKFNVGDWIVNQHGTVRHIEEVGNVGYQTDEGWLTHDCYEKDFHLWTIQDAKDGDVLLFEGNYNSIVLFQGIGINGKGRINYHCKCDLGNYSFGVQGDKACLGSIEKDAEHYHPATQNLRDILFKKIHEAGYMWDSDSKQLLSLKAEPNNEKKFAWNEEDEDNLTDTCVAIRKFYHRNNGAQDLIDWLQSLKERMKGMNE